MWLQQTARQAFSGLAAKGFTLSDNGMPQKIVSFEASNEATNENDSDWTV
jgi:hypothetical protein